MRLESQLKAILAYINNNFPYKAYNIVFNIASVFVEYNYISIIVENNS